MSRTKAQPRAIHEPFEGRDPRGHFTLITDDMFDSAAWQSLSLRQQGLYLNLKHKYKRVRYEGKTVRSNVHDITFPFSEWTKFYGTGNRTFKSDINALIERGFITVIEKNKCRRIPNKYGFVADWKNFKPIPKDDKNKAENKTDKDTHSRAPPKE